MYETDFDFCFCNLWTKIFLVFVSLENRSKKVAGVIVENTHKYIIVLRLNIIR
jgi:hypothetical protein